ncbi:hypothetical protein V5F59_11360 [Xanthobacter autotrophicus DSM 431]
MPSEFLSIFCHSGMRAHFHKPMHDVLEFARARGASMILVGGSFISTKEVPSDLDCAIVFAKEEQIPDRAERVEISGVRLDMFFCAADQTGMLGSMVQLFANSRNNVKVGVIAIPLQETVGPELWSGIDLDDTTGLEIIQRAYAFRHITDRNPGEKALVTIHGILTHAEWNSEIAHIASANGWVVAPFTYGYVDATVFLDGKKRQEIVDNFRNHLEDISSRYGSDLSIIAHSFGTYIAAAYLWGFDITPVPIDTLILTGSVLDPNLDFAEVSNSVGHVIHERAPNDKVVRFAAPAGLMQVKLLGKSGEIGFRKPAANLEEMTCDIFNHTNVIRRDVISRRWMPRLEINLGLGRRRAVEKMSAAARARIV